MSINLIETLEVKSTSKVLDSEKVRVMYLILTADQKVPPCLMSMAVLYYVVEGQGSLIVESENTELHTGSLSVVPAGTIRSISATTPMRILAVQIL